jgi:hypothetical protein
VKRARMKNGRLEVEFVEVANDGVA